MKLKAMKLAAIIGAASAALTDDQLTRLERMNRLKSAGALSETEFVSAKEAIFKEAGIGTKTTTTRRS